MSDVHLRTRVVIADSHLLFRSGVRMLLEMDPKICVVGDAADGQEAVELTRALKPDVTLLELGITNCSGVEAMGFIQRLPSAVHTLVLTTKGEEFQYLETIRLGASGLVSKECSSQLLCKSIHAVMAGEYWIGRQIISELVRELRHSTRSPPTGIGQEKWKLTKREHQIVTEIVSGSTNKQIAKDLNLSEQTVKHHLTSIFNKVGASNRLELALMVRHFSVNEALPRRDRQENRTITDSTRSYPSASALIGTPKGSTAGSTSGGSIGLD
jgi:two-component system nitrate/nitrite response regulator NarL